MTYTYLEAPSSCSSLEWRIKPSVTRYTCISSRHWRFFFPFSKYHPVHFAAPNAAPPCLLSAYLFTSIWASFSNESSILKAGDAPPPGERDGRTTRTTAAMQVAPAENYSNLTLPTLSYLSPAYEVLSILRCSSELSQSLHTVMFEARVGKEICPAAAVPVREACGRDAFVHTPEVTQLLSLSRSHTQG